MYTYHNSNDGIIIIIIVVINVVCYMMLRAKVQPRLFFLSAKEEVSPSWADARAPPLSLYMYIYIYICIYTYICTHTHTYYRP